MSYTGRHRAIKRSQGSWDYVVYAHAVGLDAQTEQPDRSRAKRGYRGEHRERDTQYTRIDRRLEHDRDNTHVVDNRVTIYGNAHIATLLRDM